VFSGGGGWGWGPPRPPPGGGGARRGGAAPPPPGPIGGWGGTTGGGGAPGGGGDQLGHAEALKEEGALRERGGRRWRHGRDSRIYRTLILLYKRGYQKIHAREWPEWRWRGGPALGAHPRHGGAPRPRGPGAGTKSLKNPETCRGKAACAHGIGGASRHFRNQLTLTSILARFSGPENSATSASSLARFILSRDPVGFPSEGPRACAVGSRGLPRGEGSEGARQAPVA